MMRVLLFAAALLGTALPVVLSAPGARADFMAGLAAYDGGDYADARGEWLPLARDGNAEAQVALADLYAGGFGVAQNFATAAQWLRRAALQGHVVAQLNLGEFYTLGRGVRRDPVRAWVWLTLAARQGSEWAALRRDTLASEMTPQGRGAALRWLADWRKMPR